MNENLNAKDLFSVGVKIIGLLSLGRGFFDLLFVLFYWAGLSYSSVTSEQDMTNLKYGLGYLICGLYLLRGAKLIVDFAFPDRLAEYTALESSAQQKIDNPDK